MTFELVFRWNEKSMGEKDWNNFHNFNNLNNFPPTEPRYGAHNRKIIIGRVFRLSPAVKIQLDFLLFQFMILLVPGEQSKHESRSTFMIQITRFAFKSASQLTAI